jgi:precorrin-2 dehydrogenase/sirohydrochlorin ferrochelatase
MTPLTVDLAGAPVLVVGGGTVGRRKGLFAFSAGARVTVLDPNARTTGYDETGVEWVAAAYEESRLDGVFCVFAAATEPVNAAVVADCRKRGLLVCDSIRPERGNFTLPAVGHVGRVMVAVGTGGASPPLAARLRDEIVAAIDPILAEYLEVLAEVRPGIVHAVADPVTRRALLRELASAEAVGRFRAGGREAVAAFIRGRTSG